MGAVDRPKKKTSYLPIKWAGSQRPTPLYSSEVEGRWVKMGYLKYQYKTMKEEKWISKGEKKRVWRCLNRVEHGTEYCKKSVSLDEEKLHGAIFRGLRKAFEYREDVTGLILSGLSYAVTGDDNILDVYVIEQKIKEIRRDMEDMVMLSMRTEGDTERFEIEIQKLSEQLSAMREQLDIAKTQMASSEKVNAEAEKIKAFLAEEDVNFSEYSEIAVRRLIECIRVMPDKKILIVLKGGVTIEEQVE